MRDAFQYEKQAVVSEAKDLAELTTPPLRDLALETRQQVLDQFDILQKKVPIWHKRKAAQEIPRLLTRRYLPAINQIRGLADRSELIRIRDRLRDRLNRGWELESTSKRDELAVRLLAELEVVNDALSDNAIGPYLDRVNTWWAGE